MNIPNTYTFHTDPGHGWIEVPKFVLDYLGISHLISPYSYLRNGVAFLEEDCDASMFVKAYEGEFGQAPTLMDNYKEHTHIRNYNPYPSTGYSYEAFKAFMGY